MNNPIKGYVYLIHLDQKFHHVQHYIGWTLGPPEERLEKHIQGSGSRLLKAADRAGISYQLSRIWTHRTRHFERLLKKRKNSKRLCPICEGEKSMNRAQYLHLNQVEF